jgi:hypothetical protein
MTQNHPSVSGDLPGHGHNRPPDDKRQEIIDAFTAILLADRGSDKSCLLDSIFTKAERSRRGKQPPPDVLLTNLLLFEEGQIPRHTNLFNAELGILTEKLLKALFEITRGEITDTSDASMVALEKEFEASKTGRTGAKPRKGKAPEWKKPDFLLGASKVVECKYRFNSYEAKVKQIRVGLAYKTIGLSPVFLHLSPDFQHRKDFVDQGWEVQTGDDMLDYIFDHTGYNLGDLLSEVSAQPIVRQRLQDAHQQMVEDQKSRLWSSYKYAPGDVRDDFHNRFADCHASMNEIAKRSGTSPPSPETCNSPLETRGLRDLAEALNDRAAKDPPQAKKDMILNILKSLDENERAELLLEAMKDSSEHTRMTVISVFG